MSLLYRKTHTVRSGSKAPKRAYRKKTAAQKAAGQRRLEAARKTASLRAQVVTRREAAAARVRERARVRASQFGGALTKEQKEAREAFIKEKLDNNIDTIMEIYRDAVYRFNEVLMSEWRTRLADIFDNAALDISQYDNLDEAADAIGVSIADLFAEVYPFKDLSVEEVREEITDQIWLDSPEDIQAATAESLVRFVIEDIERTD